MSPSRTFSTVKGAWPLAFAVRLSQSATAKIAPILSVEEVINVVPKIVVGSSTHLKDGPTQRLGRHHCGLDSESGFPSQRSL